MVDYVIAPRCVVCHTAGMASAKKASASQQKQGRKRPVGTGLKPTPPHLAEWIRLANLVPVGTFLPDIVVLDRLGDGPSWADVLERVFVLPPAVQNELIARSQQTPPPEDSVTRQDDWWKGIPPDLVKIAVVDECYNRIRTAYLHLRMISQADSRSIDPLESLVRDLRYADLSYLRQCAYGKCGKIFYASKSRQPGCTPEHSSAVRKKNKRERDKKNRQDPKIKQKRAKTTRKR